MKQRNKSKYMTYDKNVVFLKSTVLEVIERDKQMPSGTFRTLFKIKHPSKEGALTCVLWERHCMEEGEKIEMKGVYKENIFVAYSAMTHKKQTEKQNGNI